MSKRPLVLEGTSLFQQHLQPSKPPASATKAQLDLYAQILARRTHQLNHLPLTFLQTIYNTLFDTHQNPELITLLKHLPSKVPQTALEHVSLVRYLLTGHFHKSIDSKLGPQDRTAALNSLKEILFLLDDTHTQYTKTLGEKSKSGGGGGGVVIDKTSVAGSDPSLQKKQSTNNGATASSNGTASTTPVATAAMGANHSQPAGPPTAGGGGANDVIEILDDTPPSSPAPAPLPDPPASESKESNSKSSSSKTSPGTQATPASTSSPSKQGSSSTTRTSPPKAPPTPKPDLPIAPPTEPKKPPGRTIPEDHSKPPRPTLGPTDPFRAQQPVQVDFNADMMKPSLSASLDLYMRPRVKVTFLSGVDRNATRHNAFGTCLEGSGLDDIEKRLERWDPYWKVLVDCSVTSRTIRGETYEFGTKTAPVQQCVPLVKAPLLTACQLNVDFKKVERANLKGFAWGAPLESSSYRNGDKRFIMRTLPLKIPEKYKKKRSDTHIWPKGTFFQINHKAQMLNQRKQQTHDHKLWKGMSYPMDLTPFIYAPRKCLLEMATKDPDLYGVQVAVCEYRSPETLYELCLSPPHTPGSIEKWSYDEGLRVAMEHANQGAVVLDSDEEDGEDGFTDRDVTLTFSLLCPMSYQAIETPVRGRGCKHIQCFDLMNYLKSNATVSGGRWRCAVCEEFVSLQDLILDGMVVKMLEKHGRQVSGSRDKISFCRDGSWFMRDENKLRYQKKRPSQDASGGVGKRSKTESSNTVEEIIDID